MENNTQEATQEVTDEAQEVTPQATEEAPVGETPETEAVAEEKDTNANREAAKYRHQAKEAREEADQLRGAVSKLQQQIVYNTCKGVLKDPADFFRYASLEDVLSEDGLIDMKRLEETLSELQQKRSYLVRHQPPIGRPKMPQGIPLRAQNTRKVSSIERAFGTDSSVTFADVLHNQGEREPAVRAGKRRDTVHLEKRAE